jgi:WD40 repeat protein
VIFTPDGKQLISVSYDTTIRVWDVATGALRNIIRGQVGGDGFEGQLYAAALSPDGKTLAVGGWLAYNDSKYGRIRLIKIETGELVGTLDDSSGWRGDALAFAPDGKWIAASGASGGAVTLWDVSAIAATPGIILTEPLAALDGHTDDVYGVAFAPDGTQIVSASLGTTLRLWSLPAGLAEAKREGFELSVASKVMERHVSEVRNVAYAPNGQYILSTGIDCAFQETPPQPSPKGREPDTPSFGGGRGEDSEKLRLCRC